MLRIAGVKYGLVKRIQNSEDSSVNPSAKYHSLDVLFEHGDTAEPAGWIARCSTLAAESLTST